jgi:FAD-NAD(P)-binding
VSAGPGQVTRLAIVGGGPTCTYAMERLAATADRLPAGAKLEIHVFDCGGQFGAGQVHSPRQPVTSFLNRIVGQVAFAADESVVTANPLLNAELRPTLLEWCRQQYAETKDPVFDLSAEDWPKRYVHGLALRSQFERYTALLGARPRVSVLLHTDEVIDLEELDEGLRVISAHGSAPDLVADHVLMATGHSTNRPECSPLRARWWSFARKHRAVFVSAAYPLEENLNEEVVSTGHTVGCVGMGLTAIDLILYLSEGRGGRFIREESGRLRYTPSGAEPRLIVASSAAGLFTFARPFNAKEQDLAALEHTGVFLTENAIDRLRASVGVPARIGAGIRMQLDFERHVFPLIILEMAHLYYTTLLGPAFGRELASRIWPVYVDFLGAGGGTRQQAVGLLLTPVEAAADEAERIVNGALDGSVRLGAPDLPTWSMAAVLRYATVVFGSEAAALLEPVLDDPVELRRLSGQLTSPWAHERDFRGNRFSWDATITPIPDSACASPEDYRKAMIKFMVRDHLRASQNNLENPAKAAADGVWRDLRDVLAHAADFGGLEPVSHQKFLDVYMRHHNRLANGAALEVMEKILALIEYGLVDVSVGPGTLVETDTDKGTFVLLGPRTGVRRTVDVLVDAHVHPFDPEADTAPIYPSLLRRGLVRKWRNPGPPGSPGFEPGGLDLTADFHPVRADGRVNERLTFLGPPSEGVMFFQLGALRPNQNHHVMLDILRWLDAFWAQVALSIPASETHAVSVH